MRSGRPLASKRQRLPLPGLPRGADDGPGGERPFEPRRVDGSLSPDEAGSSLTMAYTEPPGPNAIAWRSLPGESNRTPARPALEIR